MKPFQEPFMMGDHLFKLAELRKKAVPVGKIMKLYSRPLIPKKHKARSKYMPHIGKKQMAKAGAALNTASATREKA